MTAPWETAALEALASGNGGAIRRALAAADAASAAELRIAILRTYTIETQADVLRLGVAAATGRRANLALADLGVLEGELFDAASPTLAARPDALVVLWRLGELHPDFVERGDAWAPAARRAAVDALEARIRGLVAGYAPHARAPIFLSTFAAPRLPLHDATQPFGIAYATARLNALLYELAADHAFVHVFDVAAWAASEGESAFDDRLDLFARQPVSSRAAGRFALALARTLRPLVRPAAKVLAIDLDNVLWGGVLGEEGWNGVAVGADFPGNVHRRIQLAALRLRARGTLLVLLSKNDLAPVEEAFRRRSEMLLTLDDFAAVRVNWEPKHANLADVAEELRLGLDAFVFLDDSAFEREDVRFHLPQVQVLECGDDALSILRALERTDAFDVLRVGRADRDRADDYVREAARRAHSEATADPAAFLHSLDLVAQIADVGPESLARTVQMLQKTNQFNVTTRRHTAADVARMLDDGAVAVTLSLRDKFGDQGIVGLAIATVTGNTAEVDSFLLSCRALGRGADDALWSALLGRLRERGVDDVVARYVPTAKNAQVGGLFERYGMTVTARGAAETCYRLALRDVPAPPAWIAVESSPARSLATARATDAAQ